MAVAAVQFTGETTLDVQFILEAALVNFDELAVAVRSIQRGGAWDPIQVQVLREPPTLKPTP